MGVKHERYALLWRLGVETGLRVSDMLKFKPDVLMGVGFEVIEQKTGKPREIVLSATLKRDLRRYVKRFKLETNDFVFFSRESKKDKALSRQQAHSVIRLIASEMGLKLVGCHSMRKTFAVNQFLTTGDLEGLQRVLNHKHITTTMVYVRDVLMAGRAALKK